MSPDDVLLFEINSESLSVDNVNLDSFKFYPNPTSKLINFEANRIINKITVYNILGQEVITKQGLVNSMQVNMEHLPQGVYLMKLFIEHHIKTVSVIKN